VAEYHAGILPEDELLIRAAPFGLLQQIFYHEVAMAALAVGDRHKAQEYFQKVVETVQVGSWYYHSAGMFLERLRTDPSWPSWIERTDRR
jgi:hypothetical protein